MADTTNQYHTHISSKHKLFSLNLKEVWRYKDLIMLFTKRSFVLTYKQTVLGPAWIFLNPLISGLIYAFVFGKNLTDGNFSSIENSEYPASVYGIDDNVSVLELFDGKYVE